MIIGLLFLFLFFSSPLAAFPFAYDRATHCAQAGNWDGALHQLEDLVVDNPESASILYDTGVAAFHTGDTMSAIAYFEQASQCTYDSLLQEKSLINVGTLYAKNGDFKTAVSFLERALALNPHNESAQKKLEEFKKKLEEEQQQKNNDNTNADEDDEKEEQQKNGDNDDNTHSESDQQQKSDSGGEQQEDQSNSNNDNSEQKDESEKSPDESHDDNASKSNPAENQSETSKESDAATAPEDDAHNNAEQSNSGQQPDTAQQSEADTAVQQNDCDEEKKGTVAMLNEALDKKENEWMRSLLEQYENHDIVGNKQLLRTRLQQGGSENAHTKNW